MIYFNTLFGYDMESTLKELIFRSDRFKNSPCVLTLLKKRLKALVLYSWTFI